MKTLKFIRDHITFFIILILGLISLAFGVLIFGGGDWYSWYYESVFVPLNTTIQSVFKYSEVPFYMVIGVIILVLLVGQVLNSDRKNWRTLLTGWLFFLLSTAIMVIVLFYWLWGYNYGRDTISSTFFKNDFVTLDSSKFKSRWSLQTNRVNHLRKQFVMPDSTDRQLTRRYADLFRRVAKDLPFSFQLDMNLQPQCKEFIPQGGLLRLNTAGFYFPFGSESYVDQALHVSQKPFVIAHELSHGYGVTDEGDANFIGYLLCQASGDPLARYSSELSLWLYMASDGRHLDPAFVQGNWDNLSPAVWKDLDERRRLDDQYPEIMPRFRDAVYDSYLSMNKVEGGIKSYNRFVKMVLTYETMKK